MYIVSVTLFLTVCPERRPNAYFGGKFCCATREEKALDESCDGFKFQRSSTCCKDNSYVECPQTYDCLDFDSGTGKGLNFSMLDFMLLH